MRLDETNKKLLGFNATSLYSSRRKDFMNLFTGFIKSKGLDIDEIRASSWSNSINLKFKNGHELSVYFNSNTKSDEPQIITNLRITAKNDKGHAGRSLDITSTTMSALLRELYDLYENPIETGSKGDSFVLNKVIKRQGLNNYYTVNKASESVSLYYNGLGKSHFGTLILTTPKLIKWISKKFIERGFGLEKIAYDDRIDLSFKKSDKDETKLYKSLNVKINNFYKKNDVNEAKVKMFNSMFKE